MARPDTNIEYCNWCNSYVLEYKLNIIVNCIFTLKGRRREIMSIFPFFLLQMKDIRHENVNLFMGFFLDCGVFGIMTEFCLRGSIQDLLRNDNVKLDWMFKSSLILDLIKVGHTRTSTHIHTYARTHAHCILLCV